MLAGVPDFSWIIWLFILAQFFVPLYQKQMLERWRNGAFQAFEQSTTARPTLTGSR